ncbi:MAG: tRNA (adenosine(37)-N6)-threonylcarbamoyltransferase complex ATPase subunit type 1 TsaE [Planctomycetes bacterium]|nr:tRNA (adenosine(37)-N6)-threonylcarbamoyltransferase complex ATPase subunit type 1 TsaE [Planctomycetota bacterium]
MEDQTTTHSLDETIALGRRFAARLGVGDCVALDGPLGAGKTQFARGVALGLGLDDGRMVRSPTFVLMQEYPARVPIYHLDAYRLGDPQAELIDLGFEEMLADGVVLLEWAERAPSLLPEGTWHVTIEITGPTDRRFTIRRGGPESPAPPRG